MASSSSWFFTYKEFKKIQEENAVKELDGYDPYCEACNGSGVLTCECCDNEEECKDCGGVGYLGTIDPRPSPNAYFKACMQTVLKLTDYKNGDLLDESIKFIKFYNEQGLPRFSRNLR